MKKINMLAVAFVMVVVAASVAKAQEVKVGFDSGISCSAATCRLMGGDWQSSFNIPEPSGQENKLLYPQSTDPEEGLDCRPITVSPGLEIGVCIPILNVRTNSAGKNGKSGDIIIVSKAIEKALSEYSSTHQDARRVLESIAREKSGIIVCDGKKARLVRASESDFGAPSKGWESSIPVVGGLLGGINAASQLIDGVLDAAIEIVPDAIQEHASHQYNNPNDYQPGSGDSENSHSMHTNSSGNGDSDYDVNKLLRR